MDKRKIQKIEEASKKVEEKQAEAKKKQAKEKEKKLNIVDILLDEENKDPITLVDGNGKQLSFEQIAVIPFKERLYCVLKPIDHIDGVNEDEAIVFVVREEEGKDPVLLVETDEKVAMDVFEEYYNLLDAEEGKK